MTFQLPVEELTSRERLERIEKMIGDGKVKLNDIPIAELQRALEKSWQADSDRVLGKGTVSEESLQPPEAWHVVGAAGQPAFKNAWANTGAGYSGASFYRDVTGQVTIRGLVTGGVLNSVVFTLPAGFIPPDNLIWASWQNGAFCAFQVLGTSSGATAGDVQQQSGAANVNLTINCSFRAS